MRGKKLSIREAASKLATTTEAHLEKFPEAERTDRLRAFYKAVSNAVGLAPNAQSVLALP